MNELFPYQVDAVEWIKKRNHAVLSLEMGLGKTIVSIRAADELKAANVLVVAMAIGRVNWQREFEKWTTLKRNYTLLKTGQDKPVQNTVNITSYDYVQRNSDHLKLPWDLIIFDEFHMLKSPKAKRTRAALGKSGIVRDAKRLWFLSGTPAPNNFSEMWPTLFTINATQLSFDDFTKRYCHVIDSEYGPIIRGNRLDMIPEMKKILEPVMLRRLKEKGMLPDIFYQDLLVDAGEVVFEEQKSFFEWTWPEDRRPELMEKLKKEEQVVENMFSVMKYQTGEASMKMLEGLAPSVSTLRRYLGLQKVASIAEIVDYELECKAYDKIVIFAIHRDVINGLREKLKHHDVVTLYGGMPDDTKQKHLDRFNKNPRCKIFIGNIMSAGTTINLTVAHQVLFAELDWVPGNNAQAAMRVHRYGQTKPVTVRFASIFDSLDEKIATTVKRKARELTQIFDDNRAPKDLDLENEFTKITPDLFAKNLGDALAKKMSDEINSRQTKTDLVTSCERDIEDDIFS